MNMKLKITFILIGTLIVGMVIGAMANRAFLHNRVQRVFQKRTPNVFVQSYMDTIKPSEEQQRLIQEILERNARIMSDIRQKNRQDLEAVMESMTAELETVLTPEQMERLEQSTFGGRPSFGRRSVEDELAFLTGELGLTEDQSARIKKILEQFRRRPEMKKMGSPQEMATGFRKQREEREKEIKKILTEEQIKKYEEIQQNRQRGFRDSRF
jgi:hypothetical protein